MLSLLLAMLGAPASPDVLINEQIQYYRIEGSSPNDLAEQMQARGPVQPLTGRRSNALTYWTVTWSHHGESHEGGCRVSDVDVMVNIVMTLPQWAGEQGNQPLAREWRRYASSVQEHEYVHRQHAREAAIAVRNALWAVPYQPGCDELERAMNRAARKELKRFAALSRQYDAQTGFGTTQGARLRQVSRP